MIVFIFHNSPKMDKMDGNWVGHTDWQGKLLWQFETDDSGFLPHAFLHVPPGISKRFLQ